MLRNDCLAYKTNYTHHVNAWYSNVGSVNKLVDNSGSTIVNSKCDIACWIQCVRSLTQHH